jgi:hypothetical protein
LVAPKACARSDRWRRSAADLARFFAVVPLIACVCCTRLHFSAAIKSITGGGVVISQTDRGANSRLNS